MKVIDLLNKIANNEEVPKKIKFRDLILEWDYEYGDYKFIKTGNHFLHNGIAPAILNTEIEIIEEKPKKIEELEEIREITQDCFDNWTCAKRINQLNENQKKIIKAVNYLLEKESDK